MNVLLAEDETYLSGALCRLLEKNGYGTEAVDNGLDALDRLHSGSFDAAILDIMMPGMDGISVLKTLRREGNRIPVLLLTARCEVEDRVQGLDSGADDYLGKPFSISELLSRLRAITRNEMPCEHKLSLANITLDTENLSLSSPTASFRLTVREKQIMELFMMSPNRPIRASRIREKVWGNDSESDIRIVQIYIAYLRKKLTALGAQLQIIYRDDCFTLDSSGTWL